MEPPTKIISSISDLDKFAPFNSSAKGCDNLSNKSLHISFSNFSLAILKWISLSLIKLSTCISASFLMLNIFFACSHAILSLSNDFLSIWSLNSSRPWTCKQCSSNLLSKSSPPKYLSDIFDFTSYSFFWRLIFKIAKSKVPPPKSKTMTFLYIFILFSLIRQKLFCTFVIIFWGLFLLSLFSLNNFEKVGASALKGQKFCPNPYESAAAVGSLMILITSKLASFAASIVAHLWASSKYAGTVITTFFIGFINNFSASFTNFFKTKDDNISGVNFFSSPFWIKEIIGFFVLSSFMIS